MYGRIKMYHSEATLILSFCHLQPNQTLTNSKKEVAHFKLSMLCLEEIPGAAAAIVQPRRKPAGGHSRTSGWQVIR